MRIKDNVKLTQEQKQAVEFKGKNILVSAGAGTGKTRVLVEKFLHLVIRDKAPVGEILALTFTDKAANEMKSRIYERFSELGLDWARRELESSCISTFHSFASRLLKEHPIEAGVDPDFKVIETEESDFLKEQAMDDAIEKECSPGSAAFELLKIYGETAVRDGMFTVLSAARHEGKSLKEFFKAPEAGDAAGKEIFVETLLEKLGENGLAKEWKRFASRDGWDWDTVEEFKDWKKNFSRRGGKDTKQDWQAVKEGAQEFLSSRIDKMLAPWREKFENLSLSFESLYEAGKREKGLLDFDDLQIRAVELFRKENPISRKILKQYRERFQWILVDEFQDTNALQIGFIEMLAAKDNLFLVGDYKQSIYGFRGAEPSLFLGKENRYRKEEEGVCVPLLTNFRSQKPVLEFINGFFRGLWEEDRFVFEDLIFGSEKNIPSGVELLMTKVKDKESADRARMREAAVIAGRILELHGEGTAFGEMAILFSAMTASGIYEQALKNAGIPYYVISGRGFYHQPEIRDMMNFLAHLENPLSDIPLAATLRSPFFQVSDNTLFWLARCAKEEGKKEWNPLYLGLGQAEGIGEIPASEKEKLRSFLAVTQELGKEKDRLRLTELLDRIMEKTAYELTALADPQGVRKYANLKKLLNLARECESHESMSIRAFLKTVKRLQTQEIRESEAQVESEKSGKVVRLMTIHKAKGLEFPVVFIADLGREKRDSDGGKVIAEPGLGYSMKIRNENTLQFKDLPLSWTKIEERIFRKEREEWKRLFYVAMTRAEARLVLSGVCKEKKDPGDRFLDMSSWMDWMVNAPEQMLQGLKICEKETVSQSIPRLVPAQKEYFHQLLSGPKPEQLEALFKTREERDFTETKLQNLLDRLAPREQLFSKIIDLPVSAYAAFEKNQAAYGRLYEIGYPGWLIDESEDERGEKAGEKIEEEISAADFGSAVHKALEQLDFKKPDLSLPSLSRHFRGMPQEKVKEASALLQGFVQSDLFGRIQKAKRLKREISFVMNQRHGVIHGVIDLLFQDSEANWHIVDYKTAFGDPGKVKKAAYDLQIKIYAQALQSVLKIVPVSGILYFLRNQWEYRMPYESGDFQKMNADLQALQERILDFRQQLIAGSRL